MSAPLSDADRARIREHLVDGDEAAAYRIFEASSAEHDGGRRILAFSELVSALVGELPRAPVPPAPLLDAAWTFFVKRASGREHRAAFTSVAARYTREQSMVAARLARELGNAANEVAERVQADEITADVACAELATRHPGFGKTTYDAALAHGLFTMR